MLMYQHSRSGVLRPGRAKMKPTVLQRTAASKARRSHLLKSAPALLIIVEEPARQSAEDPRRTLLL